MRHKRWISANTPIARNYSNVICPAIAHSLPLGTKSSECRSKPRPTGSSTIKKLFQKAQVQVPRNENEIWDLGPIQTGSGGGDEAARNARMGVAYDCSGPAVVESLVSGQWKMDRGRWQIVFFFFRKKKRDRKSPQFFFGVLVEAKLVPTSAWPGKNRRRTTVLKTGVGRNDVVRQTGN